MINKPAVTTPALLPRIEGRILVIRGSRVMVDADLAMLYGVLTRRLNEQVKRNANRFPGDFMFQLTPAEKAEVVANCDHLSKLKFAKSLPFAFTEFGAIQAANVLASSQAVEMGIFVMLESDGKAVRVGDLDGIAGGVVDRGRPGTRMAIAF